MAEKQKEPKKWAISSDKALTEALRFLSDKTKKSQIGLLHELLDRMMLIAVGYEDFGSWVQDSKNQIIITFYGKPKMISGKVTIPECLSEKAKEEIPEKIMRLEVEEKLAKKKDVKA